MVLRLRKFWVYPLLLGLTLLCIAGIVSVRFFLPTATSPAEDGTPVPILMYHSIRKDPSAIGTYVITPTQLETDLKYLRDNHYHTVLMEDLIAYVQEGTPLPENPVVLTFDDGYYNNYVYAYPLLQKYDMKAIISIIGYCTDLYSDTKENNAAYSNCTWEQLREMTQSGRIEVQNHTYHLHTYDSARKGCAKNSWENLIDYTQMLTEDVEKLQQEIFQNLGYYPTTFTYPFGSYTTETCALIRDLGFSATLSCVSGMNYLSPGDTESLICMKRFLRSDTHPAAEYLSTKK